MKQLFKTISRGECPNRLKSDFLSIPINRSRSTTLFRLICLTCTVTACYAGDLLELVRRGDIDTLAQSDTATIISARTGCGESALHITARRGDAVIARWLLQQNAKVNATDTCGQTPLMIAAQCGHYDIISLLLSNGAAPAICTPAGHNATAYALMNGFSNLGETLARQTLPCPLDLAYIIQWGHSADLRPLLAAGIVANKPSQRGLSPLPLAVARKQLDIVDPLLALGCPIDGIDNLGRSALHQAALGKHLRLATQLLDIGADPGLVDSNDAHTPLHCAATVDAPNVAQLLIDAGAPVDKGDKNNASALFIAAQYNNLATAAVLLQAGADTQVAVNGELTPLRRVQQMLDKGNTGFQAMADMLRSFGATP